MEKPEIVKLHKWATKWLGKNVSITDIDLAGSGSAGINIYDLKYRTPFVSKAQRELLTKNKLIHLVILNFPERQSEDGKYLFEAPDEIQQSLGGMEADSQKPYRIYCPYAKQEIEYVEHQWSWHVTSPPQAYLTKSEAWSIFRGDAPWPCCGRTTYPR